MKDPAARIPFEQRRSQNLTFWDYLRDHLSLFLLPFAASGTGWLIGKQIPMAPEDPATAASGRKSLLKQYGDFMHSQLKGPDHGKLVAAYAFKAGAAITLFLAWRKEETKRLNVANVVDKVKTVADLQVSDAAVETENALLGRMIEFRQQQQDRLLRALEQLDGEAIPLHQERLAAEQIGEAPAVISRFSGK